MSFYAGEGGYLVDLCDMPQIDAVQAAVDSKIEELRTIESVYRQGAFTEREALSLISGGKVKKERVRVCAHADDDSKPVHLLSPGEKCDR